MPSPVGLVIPTQRVFMYTTPTAPSFGFLLPPSSVINFLYYSSVITPNYSSPYLLTFPVPPLDLHTTHLQLLLPSSPYLPLALPSTSDSCSVTWIRFPVDSLLGLYFAPTFLAAWVLIPYAHSSLGSLTPRLLACWVCASLLPQPLQRPTDFTFTVCRMVPVVDGITVWVA